MTSAAEVKKRSVWALVALLATLGLLALPAVEKAGATTVLPVNDQITADNITPTDFIPANANNDVGLRCYDSVARFTATTVNQRNENLVGVGAHSQGAGSVITDMDPNTVDGSRAPEFSNCWVRDFSGPVDVAPALVVTNEANGAWSVAANAIPGMSNGDGVISIGVPMSGAIISIGSFGCSVDVSFDQASSVMGAYTDGSSGTPGNLAVDAQLDFSSNCPVPPFSTTPSQFEGEYELTSSSGTPVTITP